MAKNSIGFSFEREIKAGGVSFGMHIHKIPIGQFTTFSEKGMYDYFAVWKGITVGMECKATRSTNAFPFSNVEEHQKKALLSLHDCGGYAYVLISIRHPRKPVSYAIPIKKYLDMEKFYNEQGRKSIPYKELILLPSLTKLSTPSRWDIRCLFLKEFYNA